MEKEKLPILPLYVFNISTDRECKLMTDAQFGRYIRVLIRQWIEGCVPESPEAIIRDAGLDHDSAEQVAAMVESLFPMDGGCRKNKKLKEIREDRLEKITANKENGRRGGRPKKATEKSDAAKPTGDKLAGFEAFWGGPGKKGYFPGTKSKRDRGEKIWIKHKCCEFRAEIYAAVQAETKHKQALTASGEFCPSWKNACTWLENRCWLDEFQPAGNMSPKTHVTPSLPAESRRQKYLKSLQEERNEGE